MVNNLKSAGLRTTQPRVKILQLLEDKRHTHLSAEEIYRLLLDSGESIGIATVYRVLAQFEEAHMVKRLSFNENRSVYEISDPDHHDHVICTQCGRIDEFLDPDLEDRQHAVATDLGYRLHFHEMTLYGVCQSCRNPDDERTTNR